MVVLSGFASERMDDWYGKPGLAHDKTTPDNNFG
jgi:hypothetical protein